MNPSSPGSSTSYGKCLSLAQEYSVPHKPLSQFFTPEVMRVKTECMFLIHLREKPTCFKGALQF